MLVKINELRSSTNSVIRVVGNDAHFMSERNQEVKLYKKNLVTGIVSPDETITFSDKSVLLRNIPASEGQLVLIKALVEGELDAKQLVQVGHQYELHLPPFTKLFNGGYKLQDQYDWETVLSLAPNGELARASEFEAVLKSFGEMRS